MRQLGGMKLHVPSCHPPARKLLVLVSGRRCGDINFRHMSITDPPSSVFIKDCLGVFDTNLYMRRDVIGCTREVTDYRDGPERASGPSLLLSFWDTLLFIRLVGA